MKQLRIYVDTSVIGGCLDEEFAEESRALIAMATEKRAVLLISSLLVDELRKAPKTVQLVLEEMPESCAEMLEVSDEALLLRDNYLSAEVLGPASADDALHVALATVSRADMIVSWNFKHIVHFEKMRGFNAVNIREGYGSIEIYSPKEVV